MPDSIIASKADQALADSTANTFVVSTGPDENAIPVTPDSLTYDPGSETLATTHVVATDFTGDGSGLTALDPAAISAGTAAISISGNAATATDGLVSTGSYADPAWLTSLAGSKVSGDIAGNAASITGSITESQVTGLTADLALLAPLASPTFTTAVSVSGSSPSVNAAGTGNPAVYAASTGGVSVKIQAIGNSFGFIGTETEHKFALIANNDAKAYVFPNGVIQIMYGLQLPTLADADAIGGTLFLGSDHLDSEGKPKLCRSNAGTGTVTVIG